MGGTEFCLMPLGLAFSSPYTRPRFPPTCFGPASTLAGPSDSRAVPSESGKACSSLAGRLLMPCKELFPSAGPGSCLSEPTSSCPSSSCLGALLGWPTSTKDELPPYFRPRSWFVFFCSMPQTRSKDGTGHSAIVLDYPWW